MNETICRGITQTTDMSAENCMQPHISNQLMLDDNYNRSLNLNKYLPFSSKHLGFFQD